MAKIIANIPKANGKKEKKMKKSKIKMLTAAACLALVGTASAAWVYAGTATASANVGVKVASYADAGTITVSGNENVLVYVDKGSIKFKKSDENIKLTATYVKPAGFDDVTKNITRTFQVVISDDLANLVKFASDVETETGNTKASAWYSWTDDADIFASLPGLAYANDNMSTLMETEANYKGTVSQLLGKGSSGDDYSWYNSNTEYKAVDKYCVKINFKAVVSD